MARTTRKQNILLLVVAIGVVALSIYAILHLNKSIIGMVSGTGDKREKYKNVTLTDAQVECENHARKELSGRLKALAVDVHSTRYDELEKRFKVFMQAQLYESENARGMTKSFYVYCFSRGNRADIAQFKLVEDKDYKPAAIRKNEGGIFGWQ